MKSWFIGIKRVTILTSGIFAGLLSAVIWPMQVKADIDYGKETIMVSMGDSFSSGEGITPFYGQDLTLAKKVKNEDWLAHRSEKSWAGQLELSGLKKAMKDYKTDYRNNETVEDQDAQWYFVAASGAETKHISKEPQNKKYYKVKASTVERAHGVGTYKDENAKLQEQIKVFEGISRNEVDYITLSLGGNDVGFTEIVKSCATNVSYSEQNGLANLLINAWKNFYGDSEQSNESQPIREKLSEVYDELWEATEHHGNILVAGYPQLFNPAGGKILFKFGFNEIEAKTVNRNVSLFNAAIEKIVVDKQKAGKNIYFVSVEDAFLGHGAYADKDAFINGVEMMARSEDLDDSEWISSYSIHPNEAGAKAYAACVQDVIEWIEEGKPPISVSGQIVDKNGSPIENIEVTVLTARTKKVLFNSHTDAKGCFSEKIKKISEEIAIQISNGEEMLLEQHIPGLPLNGNNDLGIIKVSNYEVVMKVPIDSQTESATQTKSEMQTSLDAATIKKKYEQTIADYDKLMNDEKLAIEAQHNTKEPDRYTYYAIADIDNNGVDELILRYDSKEQSHLTSNDNGYAETTFVYTVIDDKVTEVLPAGTRQSGYVPSFVHEGYIRIYKGTSLINLGFSREPQEDSFYRYRDGKLSETPIASLIRGDGIWRVNNEDKTEEECESLYNTLRNGGEGYELQLYEGEISLKEPSDGFNADADMETGEIIEKYKAFIQSQGEAIGYLAYDIDKNGFPELFIVKEESLGEAVAGYELSYDIYTFSNGELILARTLGGGGYNGTRPYDFVCYPSGNGLLRRDVVWEFETVSLFKMNGKELEEELLYSGATTDHPGEFPTYYGGTENLNQCAMNDFTALYEAFGVKQDNSGTDNFSKTSVMEVPSELYKEIVIENPYSITEPTTFSLTWNQGSSSAPDTIGVTLYKIDYAKYKTRGRCDLIVNGKTHETNSDAGIISSVYVADLNVNDDVKNIILVENDEGWDYTLHIYAYKGTTLTKIGDAYGEIHFPSILGDGTFETYFRRTWRAGGNDFIVFRYLYNVNSSDYTLIEQQAGTLGNINEGAGSGFREGYTVRLNKNVPFYSDPKCTQNAGTMSSGTLVDITGQEDGKLRVRYGKTDGWAVFHNNGPSDSDNDLEGYSYFC